MPDIENNNHKSIIDNAVEALRLCVEAESINRQEGLNALRFSKLGEQWSADDQNNRQLQSRPCLTINRVEAFCKQVTNQQRQQRPRIKVHAVNDIADVKIADIIAGICRHVEVNSNADTAYDTAFDSAVHIGWGYWRVVTNYSRPDSFDQEIYIESVDNPFSVYFDPNSVLPDGSDAEYCLVTDLITKKAFRRLYPGRDDGQGFTETGQGEHFAEWLTKEDIRIAEYFYIEKKLSTLCLLSDRSTMWKDELPSPDIMAGANKTIVSERESFRPYVKWCKLTAMEVLEEREWPGRWIPIVPVYGDVVVIDGLRKRYGLVKHAKDPQILYNYQRTAEIEAIGLAPKAKWLLAAGQDEGYENEWSQANISSRATLHYNQLDMNGREAPPPQRLQPEPPPTGIMESAMTAAQDLSSVLGIVDPAQRITGNVSGKALQGEKQQSDNSNFHYYDNLTRSICHTGKILLDLIPKIYDAQRIVRIIGEDGRPDMVTINEQAEGKILNDVTIGEYDVVMDTGPGYNSKRLEAVDSFMALLGTPLGEEVARSGADLAVRAMDFPGADVLADRLAAANPLAQIDEKSNIPPAAQMQIKSLQKNLQDAMQQLQAMQMELKYKGNIAQMQEQEETKREHLRQTTKAHDIEKRDATKILTNREDNAAWMHDVAVKAHTQLSVAEINGMVQLLTKQLDIKQLEKQASEEESEIA